MPRHPSSRGHLRDHLHSCWRKVKHRSRETAERALVETSAKYPDTLLQIYECLVCSQFHLGNEFTKLDAARGLKKLEGQMCHPNFWVKAPPEIIAHFQAVRLKCLKRLGLPETELILVDSNHAYALCQSREER